MARQGLTPHRGAALPPLETLAAEYASRRSIRAIARRFRRSEPRITSALREVGIDPAKFRGLSDDEARAEVERLLDQARQRRARQPRRGQSRLAAA